MKAVWPALAGDGSFPLLVAGGLTAIAAILHVITLFVGAPMYRLLGAGPMMVAMAQAGHWYPTIVTLGIAAALCAMSAYGFAGAGLLPPLPVAKLGLAAIAAVLLLRGLMLVPAWMAARHGARAFHVFGAGGSVEFWYWSSAICLLLGGLYLGGLIFAWSRL